MLLGGQLKKVNNILHLECRCGVTCKDCKEAKEHLDFHQFIHKIKKEEVLGLTQKCEFEVKN